MKDLNIKCNNKTEAEFIEKYFLDKGYKWLNDNSIMNYDIEYPGIIFNGFNGNCKVISWIYELPPIYTITEAKHYIRKEKLKRINR